MEENVQVRMNVDNPEGIYQANKKANKEKLLFFNFLMNNTKVDVHLEEVQSYLYWVSILEFFTWLVFLSLFISAPSTMAIVWIFFYHNARGITGLILLKYIPKTHEVIENLKDYENQSLEDIQKQMEENYISIIHDNEKILKPILIVYFILTIVSIFIDVILFIYIAANFGKAGVESKEFALLLGNVLFIICDFVYFSFLTSLRYSFPPETLSSIRKLAFGYFIGLKVGIANGFNSIVDRIKRRAVTRAVENAVQ